MCRGRQGPGFPLLGRGEGVRCPPCSSCGAESWGLPSKGSSKAEPPAPLPGSARRGALSFPAELELQKGACFLWTGGLNQQCGQGEAPGSGTRCKQKGRSLPAQRCSGQRALGWILACPGCPEGSGAGSWHGQHPPLEPGRGVTPRLGVGVTQAGGILVCKHPARHGDKGHFVQASLFPENRNKVMPLEAACAPSLAGSCGAEISLSSVGASSRALLWRPLHAGRQLPQAGTGVPGQGPLVQRRAHPEAGTAQGETSWCQPRRGRGLLARLVSSTAFHPLGFARKTCEGLTTSKP